MTDPLRLTAALTTRGSSLKDGDTSWSAKGLFFTAAMPISESLRASSPAYLSAYIYYIYIYIYILSSPAYLRAYIYIYIYIYILLHT